MRAALAAANSNSPLGTLEGPEQAFVLEASGPLARADLYKPLIVAWRNGAPVRLADIAVVEDSVENDKVASWLNGRRSIVLAIQRQPDANTVAVTDAVKALLPSFRAQLPPPVSLEVLVDRSLSIRGSVHDVQFTLMLTMVLVVMVIFLFLRNLRATVIPAMALPISIVGTFAGMYLWGFSINNLTLLALTLSVGFVVDDAIVMLENIVRTMEGGMRPLPAALRGSKEMSCAPSVLMNRRPVSSSGKNPLGIAPKPQIVPPIVASVTISIKGCLDNVQSRERRYSVSMPAKAASEAR